MAKLGGTGSDNLQSVQKLLLVQQKKELLKVKRGTLERRGSGEAVHHIVGDEGQEEPNNVSGLVNIVLLDPMSVLLIAWPLGCAAYFLQWGDAACFWLNFLAMIPLAKIMGDATEELAAGINNDAVGGLLNATFGNAVEMILMVQTLRAGQLGVVKGSLLGSILSNLLLVLGMSFFAGGLTRKEGRLLGKEQTFSKEAALTNMTMLFLASATFAMPTVLFSADFMDEYPREERHEITLKVSRYCSCYILCAYVAFLLFQLYTHVDVFKGEEDEGENEPASLTPWCASGLLLVATVFVAFSSEWLVDSIDGLVDGWGIGKAFIGIILLPIVGNACEHTSAIRMAVSEKMDITIGIAIGSSTQVALFVVPFSVLTGWAIGQPMDLAFGSTNTTVMVFSVLIAFSIITDGSSNWLEGFMLMVAYAVVATLYWFVPEGAADETSG